MEYLSEEELKEMMLGQKKKYTNSIVYMKNGWICRVEEITDEGIKTTPLIKADYNFFKMMEGKANIAM